MSKIRVIRIRVIRVRVLRVRVIRLWGSCEKFSIKIEVRVRVVIW